MINLVKLLSIREMKLIVITGLICCCSTLHAQQKVASGKMSYIYTSHPYCILYHDTLFSGSKEFRKLFYLTGNAPIINLYKLHQSCKIWGNGMTYIGTLATLWGVVKVSDKSITSSERSLAWVSILGGVGCDIGGTVLITNGQRALAAAVHLFNVKNSKTTINLGVGNKEAGLVINW